jgi:diguanylate cyclase (GGDEF)-like protein
MAVQLLVLAALLTLGAAAALVVRRRARALALWRATAARARGELERAQRARAGELTKAQDRRADRRDVPGQEAELGGVDGPADALTGLAGRSDFYARLSRELALQPPGGRGVALLLLDADGFGTRSGLAALRSDSILAEIAALVQEVGGADGAAFRVGADAFALILPGCGITAAEGAFARLQATLRNRLDKYGVSISGGITAFEAGDGALDLVVRADEALRLAKRGPRGSAAVATTRSPAAAG